MITTKMLSKKNINTIIKGVTAALPAIPYVLKARQRTSVTAYIVGGVGFAVAGGIAALMFFSPKTRTRALTAAKDGYGKVSDKISHLRPVQSNGISTSEDLPLANGFGGHADFSAPTTTGL